MKKLSPGKEMGMREKAKHVQGMGERERLFDLLIHDLREPLAIVSTSTSGLLKRGEQAGSLPEDQKRGLERILRNVQKAQNLLQEMIEIFHSEEGLFQKEFFFIEKTVRASILDVLEAAIPTAAEMLCREENYEGFCSLLKPHGIFIEITGRYGRTPFCHDQKKVQQILRNLMGNALKYRRSRMSVSISGEGDLFVSVADDGRGIPAGDHETIFGRFVQLEGAEHGIRKGLGLGLTGVKAIVEAMGGEITLTSQEGSGSCFKVRIPPLPSQ
jgi:signal transduction histidine kinase